MWPDSKHKNKELKINAKHWQHNLSGMLTIIFSTSDLVVIEDLHQEALAARSFQTRRCWSSARQQWFPASLRFTSGHTLRGGTWRGVCGLEATALDLFPCVRGISAFLRTRGPAALPWPAAQRPFAPSPPGPQGPSPQHRCCPADALPSHPGLQDRFQMEDEVLESSGYPTRQRLRHDQETNGSRIAAGPGLRGACWDL